MKKIVNPPANLGMACRRCLLKISLPAFQALNSQDLDSQDLDSQDLDSQDLDSQA